MILLTNFFLFEQEQDQLIDKELNLIQQKISAADVTQVMLYLNRHV